MLSRRSLRIKVMQKLYAFEQAKSANFQMAQDLIAMTFAPDLNSMERQDLQRLEGLKQLALVQFGEMVDRKISEEEALPPKAQKAAEEALKYYEDRNKKDQSNIGRALLDEAERVYDLYLRLLLLALELGDEAKLLDERKYYEIEGEEPSPNAYKTAAFAQNALVVALRNHAGLKAEGIRHQAHWDGEQRLFVRQLLKDVVKPNELFRVYCETQNHTLSDERQIVWQVLKSIVLKSDLGLNYFEEADINWAEDEDVVLGMLKRTFKDWEETQRFELQPLSPSWEDDRYYFEDLFKYTIESDTDYEALIERQTANWDIERIALTDKILLKMALTEMVRFPSIPVKVTINEIIDIAKEYSTPKSGQFVNGILDVISQQMSKEGTIRKSGRGLIDKK